MPRVEMSNMIGDGGGYIPLSQEAVSLIFDYWADGVQANGLSYWGYYDDNLRDALYDAAEGRIDINLTKALHWDQFGYHFTGTLGADTTAIHFYVEIEFGMAKGERWHVGSDFLVKDTTTRWKIVTIANTFGYGGYNDRQRNKPPFPTVNSRKLANHMPPKKSESDTVGKWKHDRFT